MSDAYAELYEHSHPGNPIACAVAGTFYRWTSSTVGEAGPTDLLVPSAASDDITVGANGAGVYLMNLAMSFSASRNNVLIQGAIFLNGAEVDKLGFHRFLSVGADIGGSPASGLLTLATGDVLDVRVNTDINNTDVNVFHANLSAISHPRAI